MTATREHRNAMRVEDSLYNIRDEIEAAAERWQELVGALPDGFPGPDALNEIHDALERLIEEAGEPRVLAGAVERANSALRAVADLVEGTGMQAGLEDALDPWDAFANQFEEEL